MKSIAAGLLLSVFSMAPAFAALPPHYQRQAEFLAALEVAVETFGIANSVDSITLVETDRFEVKAGNCTLTVTIVDSAEAQPEGWVGPRQFTAQPTEPVCE